MEDTTLTESESRNAAKVAGALAAIALVGTLTIQARRFVTRRRSEIRARRAAHLVPADKE